MPYQCPSCTYISEKRFNVQRHIATVHKTAEFPLKVNVINDGVDAVNVNMGAVNVNMGAVNENMSKQKVYNDTPNPDSATCSKTSHQCEKCGKQFTRSHDLKRHSISCKGEANPLKCPNCQKLFSCRQSKYRHKQSCSKATINNTTYNNCTFNISINVLNFNEENVEYITREFARQCFEAGVHGVNPMIDQIYFNDEHPENHNIQLRSLNHSLVEVKTHNGWIPQGMNNVIDNIISTSTGTILHKMSGTALNPETDVYNFNAIQNIPPEHKRKIRERTKGKLVARRDLNMLEGKDGKDSKI